MAEPIHPAAATGFARAADAYERGRPGYPDAAVDWLAAFLRDPVVDLAAGTGLLSRALAARGLEVVAVEPIAEMRARVGAGVRAVDGTAEAIGLADASAGAVTVAQAFHWFDGPRALAEIARVLRPGGVLAIVFNRRRTEDAIHRRIDDLLAPHRGDTPAHAIGDWHLAVESSSLFAPVDARTFDNAQHLDGDGLVDRFGSVSFVAAMPEPARAELHAAIADLAAGASVTLRYLTDIEILRKRQTRSENVFWSPSALTRSQRQGRLGQRGATLWITGLPASGKSTLAAEVELRLVDAGRSAYRLDGDNLRHGLSGDLGFDAAGRAENVRRAAHVAALLADAGTVAVVSLVSPYATGRAAAREIHERLAIPFVEIFVDTPLEECERRDPKGLYARARRGEIAHFTGISDPYEAPSSPDARIAGHGSAIEDQVAAVLAALERAAPRPR